MTRPRKIVGRVGKPRGVVLDPVPETVETKRHRKVGTSRVLPGDVVKAFCWCGRKQVDVPIEDVAHGQTGTCGRKGCAP